MASYQALCLTAAQKVWNLIRSIPICDILNAVPARSIQKLSEGSVAGSQNCLLLLYNTSKKMHRMRKLLLLVPRMVLQPMRGG